MLELRRYSTGYAHRPLALDVNCGFEAGAVTCILGPNGCGKSTLLHSILGGAAPLGGSALADGRPLADMGARERARVVAFVAQSAEAPAGFTVLEYVLLGRAAFLDAFARPGAADEEAARVALAQVGLEGCCDRTCERLSGGEWQLACVARALAQRPRYLLMDEPCASLDLANQARLLGLLEGLAETGPGVVMTTHDPAHALALDARVLVLFADGSWRYGDAKTLLASEAISELYGCEAYAGRVEGAPEGVLAVAARIGGRMR